MHSVQRDYERCANRYQATMSQLGKPKNQTEGEKSTEVYDGSRRRERLMNAGQVETGDSFGGSAAVSEKMRDISVDSPEEYRR